MSTAWNHDKFEVWVDNKSIYQFIPGLFVPFYISLIFWTFILLELIRYEGQERNVFYLFWMLHYIMV